MKPISLANGIYNKLESVEELLRERYEFEYLFIDMYPFPPQDEFRANIITPALDEDSRGLSCARAISGFSRTLCHGKRHHPNG